MTHQRLIISTLLLLASAWNARAMPVPVPDEAVHSAARYMVEACDATGRFRYRINTDPSVRVTPKYNILRHAGTIYALASYAEQYPAARTRNALTRAVRFMQREVIAGVGSHTNMLAVWSRPAITRSDRPLQAKLGAAGLGLVALTSARRTGVTGIDLASLRRLARFILYMQKDDGRFIAKYVPDEGGQVDGWTSLYYPGEAALGLIMLYEIDPDVQWLDGATQALAYLARSRQGEEELPPDHWAMLATHRLLRLQRPWDKTRQDRLLRAHATQLSRSIVAARAPDTRYGGFTGDGRTCPTATRLEGLIAALPLLTDPLLQARSQHAVERGIEFLLHTQRKEDPWCGAWPRAVARLPSDHAAYSTAFNRRATEIRIDYVQHALAALLMYRSQQP